MKIYDCFTYFDEDELLEIRLNELNKFVDYFIIVEAGETHQGKKKMKCINENLLKKFGKKVRYFFLENLLKNQSAWTNENYQRNCVTNGLYDAKDEDIIIISDIDEIPNLKNINLTEVNNKFVIFQQQIFYYKFNLLYPNISWYGSRVCKRKNFISPQWLRNVKHRKYPFWRLDTFFSKNKYSDIHIVNDGGWHFTNIKSAEDIEKKLLNYAHHYEFEQSGLNANDIKKKISDKKVIYDHSTDQRGYKWGSEKTLETLNISKMPDYVVDNLKKYSNWLQS